MESTDDRIISSEELRRFTGLSADTIRRMEERGEFPMRIALSRSRIGWRESLVLKWLEIREAKSKKELK